MGWFANLLLIVCSWRIGYGDRHALLYGVAGSFLWAIRGFETGQIDLATIEIVLGLLQLRSWKMLGRKTI